MDGEKVEFLFLREWDEEGEGGRGNVCRTF